MNTSAVINNPAVIKAAIEGGVTVDYDGRWDDLGNESVSGDHLFSINENNMHLDGIHFSPETTETEVVDKLLNMIAIVTD